MSRKANQIVTIKLNIFLENNAYNKSEVARKSPISPEEFYLILSNKRTMSADVFASMCGILGKTPNKIMET